jgi:Flp pilus assembly protein protease CpaA
METNFFFIILVILAITDYLKRDIPNLIILPAIIVMFILNCNFVGLLTGMGIGLFLYSLKFIRGGDVKLLIFTGTYFSNIQVVMVCLASLGLVYLYRFITKNKDKLPYTPFILAASMVNFFVHLPL